MRLWSQKPTSNPFMLTYQAELEVRDFVYFYLHCMREVKAPNKLRICSGLSEPFLLTNVISNKISCADSYMYNQNTNYFQLNIYLYSVSPEKVFLYASTSLNVF